jgi:tetratricopeptide (TPR) repeat protein
MQPLAFDEAVEQLAELLRKKPAGIALIGAGVSKSGNIPLAHEIVADIRREYPSSFGNFDDKAPNAYGRAMRQLGLDDRRDLIKGYIDRAKINWGYLALAQLMKQGAIDRVLTVNFDPLLARATALLGCHPAIYDFGAAPADDTKGLASPSIVHLHGQSAGLVLLNTEEETEAHKRNIEPLIRDSVTSGPIFVLGYSGGTDSVFATLRDCYKGKRRLFWLGYDDNPTREIGRFLEKWPQAAYAGGIESDRFLIELAGKLGHWPPQIVVDPLQTLLDSLEGVTPFPVGADGASATGLDVLDHMKRTVGRLKRGEDARSQEVNSIVSRFVEGKYDDVLRLVDERLERDKDDEEVANYGYWAAINRGNEVLRRAESATTSKIMVQRLRDAERHFERAVRYAKQPVEAMSELGRTALRIAAIVDEVEVEAQIEQGRERFKAAAGFDAEQHATYLTWGNALADLGRQRGNLELIEEACEKFEKAVEQDKSSYVARRNWSFALIQMAARSDEARAKTLLEEARKHCDAALAIEPGDPEAVAYSCSATLALVSRFGEAAGGGLLDEARETCETAVAERPNEPLLLANLAGVLIALAAFKPGADVKQLLEEARAKCETALKIKVKIKGYHALAWANYGVALLGLSDFAETPKEQSELLRSAADKFETALEQAPNVPEWNLNWGVVLGKLADLDRANAADLFGAAIERFEQAGEFMQKNGEAMLLWGIALMERGKLLAGEERNTTLWAAVEKLVAAYRMKSALAVYGLACLMALLGQAEDCRGLLLTAHAEKQLPPREELERDADLASVRDLPWFAEILALADPAGNETEDAPPPLSQAAE